VHRRVRIGSRGRIVLAILAAIAAGWGGPYWYVRGEVLRGEANYYREMSGLRGDIADRLEATLALASGDGPGREEAVETLFEILRSTSIGNRNEVTTWRLAPRSPERMAAALKWAKVAAEEEAWMAIMNARTAEEIGRGHIPVQYTEAEVAAFRREARSRKPEGVTDGRSDPR
jgi:hypothetical protein